MKKILICEDDPITAELFAAALSRLPYQLKMVENANAIVADAAGFAPDLILMDLRMPGVCGPEAIGHLRADERTRRTPIILHSANVGIETIAGELGVGYIGKPFSLVDFRSRIAETLGADQVAIAPR